MVIPRRKTPPLAVQTLSHGRFDIANDAPERFTLVVFYRGLHCPICANYLKELEELTPEFQARGVRTIAISADGEERARGMADKIGAEALRIGYGLDLDVAREWGLYISTSRGVSSVGIEELKLFPEPGIFLVRADQTLYCASVQTMPFARPRLADILKSVDFVIEKDYPARGEYSGAA
jgi:peroxiredoxin